MDYFKALFAVLLGLLLIIIALWVLPEVPIATGQVHPEYQTMLKSGNVITNQESTKWLAYFFGLLILILFVLSIFIGARRKRDTGNLVYWLLGGSLVYLITYHFSVMAYWKYAEAGSTNYFLGLPIPTAWAIYGLWSVPILMTLTYVLGFDQWILDKKDMQDFENLIDSHKD